jgi:hypothetical protein
MQMLGFREFNSAGRSTGRIAFAAEITKIPAAEACRWVRAYEAHADNMLTAGARELEYISRSSP